MAQEKLQAALTDLRDYIQAKGWSISSEKDIQSAKQVQVSDGINNIPVNCFSTGNIQAQGADNPLKADIQAWIQRRRDNPQSSTLW